MTCDAHTHGHVVAGGRCMHCAQPLQATGVLSGQYGPPGLAWTAAPFLDATTDNQCRRSTSGRHEARDANGMCALCGTQLEGLGDVETGRGERLMWFEIPADHPGTRPDRH